MRHNEAYSVQHTHPSVLVINNMQVYKDEKINISTNLSLASVNCINFKAPVQSNEFI